MSNHKDTVIYERVKYGSTLGIANAHKVINAVAWTWRTEGWGLLRKTSGNQYNNCSVDVLINPKTREAIDCLGDAEGAGRPQWSTIAYLPDFDGRFVAPYDPNPAPPPEPPEPPTPPPTTDLEARVAKIEAFLAATFKAW